MSLNFQAHLMLYFIFEITRGGSDLGLHHVDGLKSYSCLRLATTTGLNTYAAGLETLTVRRGCRLTL